MVVKRRQFRRREYRKPGLDFISDVIQSLSSYLFEPQTLLFLIVCSGVVITHHEAFETSKFAIHLKTSTSPISRWILANETKFLGSICFLPTVVALHGTRRTVVSVVIVTAIYILKAHTIVSYIAQSFILFLYFKIRSHHNRVLLILLVVAALWSGLTPLY